MTPGASKSEETFKITSPCRDGEVEAQRRRKTKSAVNSGCLTPRPLPSPLAKGPGSQGHQLPPLHYKPLLQGTDIKAYLQHPTPPPPSRLGPRHPEPAHPQCREHPSAVATPCGEVSRRHEATGVLILERQVSQGRGEGSEVTREHQPCRFQWVLVAWQEPGRR